MNPIINLGVKIFIKVILGVIASEEGQKILDKVLDKVLDRIDARLDANLLDCKEALTGIRDFVANDLVNKIDGLDGQVGDLSADVRNAVNTVAGIPGRVVDSLGKLNPFGKK